MDRRWIALATAVGVGVLLAVLAVSWARSPRPGTDGSHEADLAALRAELAAERDARLGLAAEVEMLRQLLVDLGAGSRFDTSPLPQTAARSGEEPKAPSPSDTKEGDQAWFDAKGLAAQGVPADDVDRLEQLFEQSELDVLYLRDQATREGWADSPRFMQALYELRNGLRQKVGDPTFDCLLYASQRPNRVVVRSLLATGPAARAGMHAGDAIVRYDDSTIFRANELQRGTSQGEAGRPVSVEVVSADGRSRQLSIPSGPLGVSLGEERRPPRTCR
jgi:hypothetical protein